MNKQNSTLGFVVMLVMTAVIFVFVGKMAIDEFHQYESTSFPTTTGKVYHSAVTVTHSSKGGTHYHVNIFYEYEVNGQSYDSTRFRYAPFTPSADQAYAAVTAHPVGSEITVYYRANDPADSLLSPGVVGRDFLFFFMLIPAAVLVLSQSGKLGLPSWLGRKGAPAGGVMLISQGSQVRARLPRYAVGTWTAWAFCGTAFASFLALTIATTRNPSTQPEAAACAAILVATGAVYLWRRMRLSSGVDDLVIDEGMRTVTLPQTFGRKHPPRLDLGAVQAIHIDPVRHRTRGGYYYTWDVMLAMRDATGAPEKLTDWRSEEKACDFAAWLRERLHVPASADQPVDPSNAFSLSSSVG